MTLELRAERCLVMGIVNRTPDSFYDGGRMGLQESIDYCLALVEQGADMLDIGGVKAGPGRDVSEEEEATRLLPVVEKIAAAVEVPLSVETGRPGIARRAVEAGAEIVNDVSSLSDPDLAGACAETGAALVLMHNGGQIRGRPRHPVYTDVVSEVRAEWKRLATVARSAGVPEHRLIADPGLDFGKNTFHSLELMRRLDELTAAPYPVLIAPSRKDVVGETLDLPLKERLEGSLALVVLCAAGGAALVRVHDVAESVRAVRMVESVLGSRAPAAPVRGLWE
ncbi:MAG: dihydropteroate synthase [Actinomycetota bacterium]